MQDACARAVRLLDPYVPIEIVCERHIEREPHPGGQEAFDIRARFPWHQQPHANVMVEITMDERLLKPARQCSVRHEYGELLNAQVKVYALEEIVAEKLRALLQHLRAMEQRGWVRSRARDYYDLWRILGEHRGHLDLADFPDFLRQKCAIRDVTFTGPESFFPPSMLAVMEKTWDQWLGPLVPGLPSYTTVIEALRPQVAALLGRPEG